VEFQQAWLLLDFGFLIRVKSLLEAMNLCMIATGVWGCDCDSDAFSPYNRLTCDGI